MMLQPQQFCSLAQVDLVAMNRASAVKFWYELFTVWQLKVKICCYSGYFCTSRRTTGGGTGCGLMFSLSISPTSHLTNLTDSQWACTSAVLDGFILFLCRVFLSSCLGIWFFLELVSFVLCCSGDCRVCWGPRQRFTGVPPNQHPSVRNYLTQPLFTIFISKDFISDMSKYKFKEQQAIIKNRTITTSFI